ncbi:hypothetical protein TIFTF001_003112 [Ficus carica]|uniref:Uncharacterized protein n=1 Tax=Ficus carica TaxID=3494 RepID=A0AA88CV95_FICCA|nr:hypothetical protein TIFTF001_003112 [Ficus carica]
MWVPGNTCNHTARKPSLRYKWAPTGTVRAHDRVCSLVPPPPDTLSPHNHLNSTPAPLPHPSPPRVHAKPPHLP